MSFDDLIGLLIFLLFVGVPLFNRIRRRGSRRPQQGPARPQAPNRAPGAPVPTEGRAPAPLDTDDPIGRRLEEARRRVEAARGSAPQTGAPAAGAPAASGGSVARGLATPPPPQQPSAPPPFVPPTVFVDAPVPPPLPTLERSVVAASAPMRVERRTKRKRPSQSAEIATTMQSDELMRLRPDDIVRGILWHQILSEPVALKGRGRGRRPSPPPSR
jgi:hypothetical protein